MTLDVAQLATTTQLLFNLVFWRSLYTLSVSLICMASVVHVASYFHANKSTKVHNARCVVQSIIVLHVCTNRSTKSLFTMSMTENVSTDYSVYIAHAQSVYVNGTGSSAHWFFVWPPCAEY